MKYIVGDIGNTSTKISILNGKFEIKKSFNFETAKIYKKNFLKRILKNHLNKNLNSDLLFSSVVPAAFKEIKKIFKSTKFKLFEIKEFNLDRIININVIYIWSNFISCYDICCIMIIVHIFTS